MLSTIQEQYEKQAGGPKYQALSRGIRSAIDEGALEIDAKLPPVRDLAWHLGITPGTVARAYSLLTSDGTLRAEVGRGTFVAGPEEEQTQPQRWTPRALPDETDQVSLFSAQLPDMGQVDMIHTAFARLGERPPRDLLKYPSREGFAPARQAVLRWLSDSQIGPVEHEDLVLTHGGQSGVSLVMQAVLRGSRPLVLVEELSYPGFRRAAELLRAEVIAVPMDEQGIRPDLLDEIAQRTGPQLLCTSAEVHNPTGLFTPESRRREIAEVAKRHGLHILEDDCYRLGPSRSPSYRAILPEQSWYVSSISKSLTPALRIGFAVAAKGHVDSLRWAAEDGFFGLSRPLADLTEDLLNRDETYELMDSVRQEFSRYITVAADVLKDFELTWSDGIPFLWLKLPRSWRAARFVQAAESLGVQIRPAEDFALRDGFAPHAVRIGVNAQVSLKSFTSAIERLKHLLENPPARISV